MSMYIRVDSIEAVGQQIISQPHHPQF